jgi:hypothetical protein
MKVRTEHFLWTLSILLLFINMGALYMMASLNVKYSTAHDALSMENRKLNELVDEGTRSKTYPPERLARPYLAVKCAFPSGTHAFLRHFEMRVEHWKTKAKEYLTLAKVAELQVGRAHPLTVPRADRLSYAAVFWCRRWSSSSRYTPSDSPCRSAAGPRGFLSLSSVQLSGGEGINPSFISLHTRFEGIKSDSGEETFCDPLPSSPSTAATTTQHPSHVRTRRLYRKCAHASATADFAPLIGRSLVGRGRMRALEHSDLYRCS